MNRLRLLLASLLFLTLYAPTTALARPAQIQTITLTPSSTHITITWNAVENAVGYNIYWGESSSDVSARTNPIQRTNGDVGLDLNPSAGDEASYDLENLTQNTTYYIGLTAYDTEDEGILSSIKSTTTSGSSTPAKPINLTSTARTQTSVSLSWEKGSSVEVKTYDVTVQVNSNIADPTAWDSTSLSNTENPPDLTAATTTISGLTANTRYRFQVQATNDEGESPSSDPLIVDTYATGQNYDTLPPFPPTITSAKLLDNLQVRLTLGNENSGMQDLNKYRVSYGTAANQLNDAIDFNPSGNLILSGLQENTTHYFAVTALDNRATDPNTSAQSQATSIYVEKITGLLDDSQIEGGCFITSAQKKTHSSFWLLLPALLLLLLLAHRRTRFILPAFLILLLPNISQALEEPLHDNLVYLKGSFLFPSDDLHEEIYDGNEAAFILGYQRHLFWGIHLGLEAGYVEKDGKKRTATGSESGEEVSLTLVPTSASLILDIPVTSEVTLFAGGGVDYWYYKEKSDSKTIDAKDNDYGVGGYHGRFGIKVLTVDPNFYHRMGVLFEGVYSVIDRFGDNDLDLGGWSANVGLFCTY
ncbi:MAG: fibronectin type III domain-containing protein [Desulfobacterales bacterium]|nr:fibronectin type III domain-containing protein [Desulfobacterales bacterium]